MRVSTEIASLSNYGSPYDIIKLLKKCGYECYDFSMFYESGYDNFVDGNDYLHKAKELRQLADQIGIKCNQTHANFPTSIKGNEEWNSKALLKTIRCLEVSSILGAEYCVVHPCNDYTPFENKVYYDKLLPYAKKLNVVICLENMWNWEKGSPNATFASCSNEDDFLKNLELLDSKYYGACLDIGHAEMKGLNTTADKMIYALGDRLKALHIHDNNKVLDSHQIPYSGQIDFSLMIKALKEINYRGDITFEACTFLKKVPVELLEDSLIFYKKIGEYFIKKINN